MERRYGQETGAILWKVFSFGVNEPFSSGGIKKALRIENKSGSVRAVLLNMNCVSESENNDPKSDGRQKQIYRRTFDPEKTGSNDCEGCFYTCSDTSGCLKFLNALTRRG